MKTVKKTWKGNKETHIENRQNPYENWTNQANIDRKIYIFEREDRNIIATNGSDPCEGNRQLGRPFQGSASGETQVGTKTPAQLDFARFWPLPVHSLLPCRHHVSKILEGLYATSSNGPWTCALSPCIDTALGMPPNPPSSIISRHTVCRAAKHCSGRTLFLCAAHNPFSRTRMFRGSAEHLQSD